MFIKDLYCKPQANFIKHAGEIILDELKEKKLADSLSDACFLNDGFVELKEFLINRGRADLVSIAMPKVQKYLMSGGYDHIFRDYARTEKISSILKYSFEKKIDRSDKYFSKNGYAWDKILEKFSEFFAGSPQSAYPIEQGCLGAWMVNSFKSYFIPSCWKDLAKIYNEKTTIVQTDEGDYNLTLLLETNDKKLSSCFVFDRDIKNIVNASVLLYANNARSSRAVYSNLVSTYISYTAKGTLSDLKDGIRVFYSSATVNRYKKDLLITNPFFIPIYPKTSSNLDSDYKRGTYKIREKMTDYLFDYLFKPTNPSGLAKIYEKIFNFDLESVTSKNLGCLFKYQKSFNFADSEEYKRAFNNTKNHEIFLTIFRGIRSLGQLINYCKIKDIDIHKIPIEIFQSDDYYKRFISLEDCLECYEATSELIKEANASVVENISNDRLYYLLQQKADFSFASIQGLLIDKEDSLDDKQFIKNYFESIYSYVQNLITKANTLTDYIVSNYKEDGDSMYDAILAASFSWLKDNKVLNLVADCLTDFDRNNIIKLFIDQELVLGCYRYIYLKIALLILLVGDMNALLNYDSYDFLQEVYSGSVKKIPKRIMSSEEILKFDESLKLACPPELDYDFFMQISKLYQILYDNYIDFIKAVNRLIDSSLREFSDIGVEAQLECTISETLELASIGIYDTKECLQSQKFNTIKSFCSLKHGYLFSGVSPVMCQGYYVHEYGYLVSPKGAVTSITDSALEQISY